MTLIVRPVCVSEIYAHFCPCSATTLADMSMSATSTFNGITASLAASGFLQVRQAVKAQ